MPSEEALYTTAAPPQMARGTYLTTVHLPGLHDNSHCLPHLLLALPWHPVLAPDWLLHQRHHVVSECSVLQGSPTKNSKGGSGRKSISAANLTDVDGAVAIMAQSPARRRLVPLPPDRKTLFVHVRLNRVHCRVTYQVSCSQTLCADRPGSIPWQFACSSCSSLAVQGLHHCHMRVCCRGVAWYNNKMKGLAVFSWSS